MNRTGKNLRTFVVLCSLLPASTLAKDIPNLTPTQLQELLASANNQVLIYSPYINNPSVAEGLRQARLKRGIQIYYITPKHYLYSQLNAYTAMFATDKMGVKIYAPKMNADRSEPFIIIDQRHLITGSMIVQEGTVADLRTASYTNNPSKLKAFLRWYVDATKTVQPINNHEFIKTYFNLKN